MQGLSNLMQLFAVGFEFFWFQKTKFFAKEQQCFCFKKCIACIANGIAAGGLNSIAGCDGKMQGNFNYAVAEPSNKAIFLLSRKS